MFLLCKDKKIDSCIYKTYGLALIINKYKPDIILNTFPTPVLSMKETKFSLDIPIHT